jgi:hypothetical protein
MKAALETIRIAEEAVDEAVNKLPKKFEGRLDFCVARKLNICVM